MMDEPRQLDPEATTLDASAGNHQGHEAATPMPTMIGQIISHYKILEKLGGGGMGEVYRARDTKLVRDVAFKVLTPDMARNSERLRRFEREARAVAALKHPNIVTIYSVEEVEGMNFLTMELVEGQTVSKELPGKGFPLSQFLRLAVELVDAVSTAHARGITHRDLKPQNVMLDESGRIKVLDFGLAKFSEPASQVDSFSMNCETSHTEEGRILGTLAYMSPEQVEGKTVDPRSDLFSLGVLLYEMATGARPFKGDTQAQLISSILRDTPPLVTDLNPDLPRHLARLLTRCLEKDLERRLQSAQDLRNELVEIEKKVVSQVGSAHSIAVLPFINMSADPDNEYFSDGLTEEIIADLSRIRALRVISRTSAMKLKGTSKDIKAIGRELDVRYALEGSVRKAGNHLRITAQLIDTASDMQLWAEKYSGNLADVFDIQEQVSRSIVAALELKLIPAEDELLSQRPIDDIHVFEYYLRAKQAIYSFTADTLDRALQLLQNGLDLAGENALLYTGMGIVYWQHINIGAGDGEACLAKVEEYSRKVFRLEPESTNGHLLVGMIKMVRGEAQQSVRHLKRVLIADPNNTEVLSRLSLMYGTVGKVTAGLPLVERLVAIDPLSPINHYRIGFLHSMDGQFTRALEHSEKMYRMDSENIAHRLIYGLELIYSQRREDAYLLFNKLAQDAPHHYFARLGLFIKYALQGRKEKVLQLLSHDFIATSRRDFHYSWRVATGYALIDEKDEALDWLENAVNRGFINYPFLAEHDPLLKSIRGEPRFRELMERVKHEWEHFEV